MLPAEPMEQHLSRLEFHTYVAGLELGQRLPGVQAVEFIRRNAGQAKLQKQNVSAPVLAAVLAGLVMLGPFSVDTFLPSFPAIQREFDISRLELQQTLALYLATLAVMTLFAKRFRNSSRTVEVSKIVSGDKPRLRHPFQLGMKSTHGIRCECCTSTADLNEVVIVQ